MVAFFAIEAAFNNIQPQAILNELDNLGGHPLLNLSSINYLGVGSSRQQWVPNPS